MSGVIKKSAVKRKPRKKAVTGSSELIGVGHPIYNEQMAIIQNQRSILSRTAMFSNQVDPKVNIDQSCGYPEDLTIEHYRLMYDREGIAKRVVDVWPDECWPEDPKIVENDEVKETPFETEWGALHAKHNIYHYMHRIDRLSGIGRYGVILLGLGDSKPLDQPADGIDEAGKKTGDVTHKLLYLRVFDEQNAKVTKFDKDTDSPRFGQPTLYTLTFDEESSGISTGRVHWSRIIHIADNRESSEVFGVPRQKPVFNRLYDGRKVFGAGGEGYWKGGFPGFAFKVDPAVVGNFNFDAAAKEALRAEMQNYFNDHQRYIASVGFDVTQLAPQVSDPSPHIEAQIKAIAITIAVPLRIFVGSEAAHVASTQDKFNMNFRVRRRQTKYLTPLEVRPVIDRFITFGILQEPEQYEVRWPDLLKLTDLEKAEVGVALTDAIQKYVSSGASTLVPPLEFLTKILGMEEKEAIAIIEAASDQISSESDDADEDDGNGD